MLRYLRENTGSWIIKIFLGIIVFVFVLLGVGTMGSKKGKHVASIGDDQITIDEYQRAYKNLVEQVRASYGGNINDELLKMFNIKKQALTMLINQKAIEAQAKKLNIKVTDKELTDSLLKTQAFQKNETFNLERYKQVLAFDGMLPEQYEMQLRNMMIQQKVKDFVLSSVAVSDMEATNWFVFQNSKTAVDYLLFNPDNYTDIKADEKQIQSYFDENKNKYKSEPRLKAVYLKYSPQDYKDVQVTPEKIKNYYEENINEFQIPEKVEARHILIKTEQDADEKIVEEAKKRAQTIYEKIKKGEDFIELAKTFSEGPAKESGGYVGSFDRQSVVKPFGDKAFSMKTDEVSEPVKTMFGWHIIKVIARFDASVTTLDATSDQIKKKLIDQEMQNSAYYKAGEAFDAVLDGDDIEQVALSTGSKLGKTELFAASGKGLDFPESGAFAREAFALQSDEISDVKQLGNAYYLIKIVERLVPELQSLADVKDRVAIDVTSKLQDEKAKQDADAIINKIKAGGTLDDIAEQANIEKQSIKLFTRNESLAEFGNSTEAVKAGFMLSQKKKVSPDVIKTSKGYLILALKEKLLPNDSEIKNNLEETKTSLARIKQGQTYRSWIDEIKKNTEVVVDPAFLN
ncbi:MAG: peptidyl-prolyl cis-trans isomerase [Desulfobacteraceae bacterium]|nr:peptidyl-prolyl cis-trans isomerase [Desulfobacteraceae bacterium]